MRSVAVAKFNSEQSLHAMWRAFRASSQLVEIDAGVVLGLLNARYYAAAQGQFISQDPSFLAIGHPSQLREITQQEQQRFLADPQQMNSYGYAKGNPITEKDPNGTSPLILGGAVAGTFYKIGTQLAYDLEFGQPSSVLSYVQAGVMGAGKGAAVGASLTYLGPAGTLRAYGYYETTNNIYNAGEMIFRNPSQYTTDQKLGAANSLYIDLASRTIGAALPKEYRVIYESLRTIYDSVQRVGTQLSQSQQQSKASQPGPQGGSGGGGGSSLPSSVTQNGITYVRNSSGLLNVAPTR